MASPRGASEISPGPSLIRVHPRSGMRNWISLIPLLVLLCSLPPAYGQAKLGGIIRDFKTKETDPSGRESVLKGKDARSSGPDEYLITGLTVETFEGGESDMLVESPECVFNRKNKTASSAGPLTVRTADERFAITGRGFRWEQDTSRLFISNEVHTTILKEALNLAALKNQIGPPMLVSTNKIEVFSGSFDYRSELAVFREKVRALESNGELNCQKLTVTFGGKGKKLQKIEAEREVTILQENAQASADHAVYDPSTETVVLTGGASWKIDNRQGRSQTVTINRANRQFKAERAVEIETPAGALGRLKLAQKASSPNPTEPPQMVHISSDSFVYADTTGLFEGAVRARTSQAMLECDRLTLVSTNANSPPNTITADGTVRILQGTNSATGSKALFEQDMNRLTLIGSPQWSIGQIRGASDLVIFYTDSEAFVGKGNVRIVLPPDIAGSFALSLPSSDRDNDQGSPTDLVIEADEVEHKGALTDFRGQVVVTDKRTTMTCAFLTLFHEPGSNAVKELWASKDVKISDGVQTATGHRAIYTAESGVIELIGNPIVETPERQVAAELITLNPQEHTLHFKGRYQIRMKAAEPKVRSASP